MENENTPTIPATMRTGLYVVGVFAAAAAIPVGLAGAEVAAAALTALSGACNALALGYRPTRPGTPS